MFRNAECWAASVLPPDLFLWVVVFGNGKKVLPLRKHFKNNKICNMETQAHISYPTTRAWSQKKVGVQVHQLTQMQELLLQAPTWSDEDYNNYLAVNNHFNRWRE
ncbi:hypothetical protein AGMMS4956_01720 [Bacteroidia bacterium]|nr:hypothetical protein AGMMS4956_01720 [Bacteroidia bacterium]